MKQPLQFGSLKLEDNLIMAPMCGCSHLPTRLFAKENGAALVFTEMAKSEAVVREVKKTFELIAFEEYERPIGIQICGGDEDVMFETGRRVTELLPDIIDINMGCPVKKIVNTEAGCALLKDPVKAGRIVNAVVRSTHLPVSLKMRIGWDLKSIKAIEMAKAAEDAGAVALTVHPRTKEQLFTGAADWDWIAKVKQAVKIPVIGNGDIKKPEDVKRMLDQTGCDGVMIGRAALGNPWLFRDARYFIDHGELPPEPDFITLADMMERHFILLSKVEGEYNAVQQMRRCACWYIRNIKGAKQIKAWASQMNLPEEVLRLAKTLRGEIPYQELCGSLSMNGGKVAV